MSHIYRVGTHVSLKNPLPGEFVGPYRVMGVKTTVAPPAYQLLRATKLPGTPLAITADEGELLLYRDPSVR